MKTAIEAIAQKLFKPQDVELVVAYASRRYLNETPEQVARALKLSRVQLNSMVVGIHFRAANDDEFRENLRLFNDAVSGQIRLDTKRWYLAHLREIEARYVSRKVIA